MSDSSSEEDLSRFQDAVDISFIKLVKTKTQKSCDQVEKNNQKLQSKRYLEEAGHYNDIKVPKDLQNRIGAKVSEIINRNVMFVDVQSPELKTQRVEGGVKLFKDSNGLMSCEGVRDISSEQHNKLAKTIKRRKLVAEEPGLDEEAKIKSAVVSGDQVLSQEETKCWQSRRKEKIFKYRRHKSRSIVMIAVE